ncbi:MAG: hypothetical protein Q8R55_06570 [Candidatus Taylorbacteria bacterium]|nr:hypothetical protein [Candidatus Taylorbacteria bacterium]
MTRKTTAKLLFVLIVLLVILNLVVYLRIYIGDLPESDNGITSSFHENGYEDSQILYVENGLVQVVTMNSKVTILFRPEPKDISRYHQGWMPAPVTLTCSYDAKSDCDFMSPYNLFVSNRRVKAVAWKFLLEKQPFKAWVHHGPGDKDYSEGLMLDFQNGESANIFMQIRTANAENLNRIAKVKREDFVELFLPEDTPYKARVNEGEFDIVAISLSGH